MPSAAATPDGQSQQIDPTAGLFESKPATPDFKKMKKAALIEFYTEHFAEITEKMKEHESALPIAPEEFAKLKVVQQREGLAELFPNPEALDSPEVTGFDPADVIHATVAEVQAIKTESDLIEVVKALQDAAEYNFFKIGGYLAEAQAKGWTGEFDDFWTFVEVTFGYKIRKAQILIQIYHALVSCGATWAEAKKVGWAKLMLIASKLEPDNYKEWFEQAEGATFASLQESLKSQKKEGKEPDPSTQSEPIKKLSFHVHEDQVPTIKEALQKAKEEGNTEYDGMALEYVCADYLSAAPSGAKPKVIEKTIDESEVPLVDRMKPFTTEEEGFVTVLEAFTEVFPTVDIDVFPDGKPNLEGYLMSLIEEHGANEVLEAAQALVDE